MSEKQNRGVSGMSKYDAMTTEELEEILRLDAQAPEEQESDTDKILYIMEVLTERKRNNGRTGKTAHEAYESFKQNYMSEIDNKPFCEVPVKTRCRVPHWVRTLTATAAVLAFLIVGSITAKAFGFNIWKSVIQWTQETFHFGEWGNSDPNHNRSYSSFREALEQGNVPTWLVPTYIPERFCLTDIKVEQTPVKKMYKAKYIYGEQVLKVIVQDYLDKSPIYVEQNKGLVEEYEASGIIYYIFTDVDLMKVTWVSGSYECSISGNLTIEELKMMIDSIERG